MQHLGRRVLCNGPMLPPAAARRIAGQRWLSVVRILDDGSIRVEDDSHSSSSSSNSSSSSAIDGTDGTSNTGPGLVRVKLRAAPCTPADLRTFASVQASNKPHPLAASPPSSSRVGRVGGSEGLWEVTAVGEGVSSLQPGDFAIPSIPAHVSRRLFPSPVAEDSPQAAADYEADAHDDRGTWTSMSTLKEDSLMRVPPPGEGGGEGGVSAQVLAHASASIATAIRILTDFAPTPTRGLERGDRVVFTGASSAVAQILLQLAAARGLESVCLVSTNEEKALAERLGAWKATDLKEFKAMRMNNSYLVADGEGGVLGFTAARALRLRGYYVSYADTSGDGVRLPVAGQIFSDTRCRGFSLSRWSAERSTQEIQSLVSSALREVVNGTLRVEGAREFPLTEALRAIEAAGAPGGPVLLRA